MNLHKDAALFNKVISDIYEKTGIALAIIEKDYFVTLFLQALQKNLPTMIFKGGTSLSKCYKVISRFSEDIDVTVDHENDLTQGQHKKIKQAVVDSAAELGLDILNLDDTRSRRDFNQYKIAYPTIYTPEGIKQYVFVETALSVRSFPTELKPIKSIIQEHLEETGMQAIADQYDLQEFAVRTQMLDRTLIDKLFALGDYYLTQKEAGHSRHLYDIYKLLPCVKLDEQFRTLVKEVREIRKVSPYCRSAQDGINIQELLTEIAKKDVYKKDYEEELSALLYEKVSYTDAKKALIDILSHDVFK